MSIQKRKPKRIYLVNRDFQLRYTKVALAVALCSTVLTIALILMPLFQLRILRFPNFVPVPFIVGMVVASILNFLIIATMGILLTHRIAGPMFGLVRHIRMLQLGRRYVPLKVRDTDDLKHLVRNFNDLVEHLANQSRKDQNAVLDVVAALKRADGAADALRVAEALSADLGRRFLTGDATQADTQPSSGTESA